jgi:hypothetical protein
MQQAVHIFKKDTRHLRFEICFVVLLAGASPLLWPLAAAYLIARLIHGEAIPGHNQFWITRPYRWTSLMAAKLFFIGVFVNLPVFLIQSYQSIHSGFPLNGTWAGLVWSQVLLIFCLSLPAAALAAITPNLVAFMFLELVALAILFVSEQLSSFGLVHLRASWPSGVEWISHSLIVSVALVAAVLILVLQFHLRKTLLSRIIAVGAVAVGIVIFLFLPPTFALNAETHFTKPRVDTRSIQLAGSPDAIPVGMGQSAFVQFALPIVISGVAPDIDIKADGIVGTLQGSGRTIPVYKSGADISIDSSGNRIFRIVVTVDPAFLRSQGNQLVTLHASVYFSLFGDAKSQTIPQQAEPLTVMDRLRCSTAEFERLVEFRCISAFRWPGQMIYAQIPGRDPASFYLGISYSPFPADLSLTPIELHSALDAQGLAPPSPLGPPSAPEVTIIARQPLAHLRRDLEVRDIRINDLIHAGPHPPPPAKRPKTN